MGNTVEESLYPNGIICVVWEKSGAHVEHAKEQFENLPPYNQLIHGSNDWKRLPVTALATSLSAIARQPPSLSDLKYGKQTANLFTLCCSKAYLNEVESTALLRSFTQALFPDITPKRPVKSSLALVATHSYEEVILCSICHTPIKNEALPVQFLNKTQLYDRAATYEKVASINPQKRACQLCLENFDSDWLDPLE